MAGSKQQNKKGNIAIFLAVVAAIAILVGTTFNAIKNKYPLPTTCQAQQQT